MPFKVIPFIAAAIGVVALLASSEALGQVANSKHDFSSGGTGGIWGSPDVNQICIFCHVPHQATTQKLIWNRTDPAQSFKVYQGSAAFRAIVGQPQAPSLRCLSCHDGSVAIDSFNQGRVGPTKMMALGDVYYPGSPYGEKGANIGGNYGGNNTVNNLADDHPISFVYDSALVAADGALKDPATVSLPLYAQRLECPTCHDVHNNTGFPMLLRKSNASSGLCLTCHVK